MDPRALALTMGDPAGIGPEITRAAWAALRRTGPAFFVIADPSLYPGAQVIGAPAEAAGVFGRALPVLAEPLAAPAVPGRADGANARATIRAIERAVALVRAGEAAAVVTNPIAKSVLYAAGFAHPGHTEFLAALTGAPRAVMMLAGPSLRVVPVTVHMPLRAAIESLTTAAIVRDAVLTHDALKRDFAIPAPRLAVAGLNPHAGEDGTLGGEDGAIVAPAVAALRAMGIGARGPVPPDALFTPRARATYDAAICLYHDQALIPLKALEGDRGVNVTLGLPIVRTSPDHGTAFDIAGQGIASAESLIAALTLAARMAQGAHL